MLTPRTTESANAPQASPTPPAAPKGPLGHPAVLVLAGVTVLLAAYALGYLPEFGSLLQDAMRSSRSSDILVFNPAFYGIAGLAAFLILLGFLRGFDMLLRKLRGTSPLKSRPAKPVEQFIVEAMAAKISLRVAREGYYLLEPHYPYKMCIDLNDDLRADLLLADESLRALEAMLLTRCDRRQAPVNATTAPALNFVTVQDFLLRAENAPPLRADRSGSRERSTDSGSRAGLGGKRQSDSAERKALHAATLQAIESGSLHDMGSSGLHRRSSDYTGPRRRATDKRDDSNYTGPFQRSTDRPAASSPLRSAQPNQYPGELHRSDPLFLPPRSKRIPEPSSTA